MNGLPEKHTFANACNDRLTIASSVGSDALSNCARISLILGVLSLLSLQNDGNSLMASLRIYLDITTKVYA